MLTCVADPSPSSLARLLPSQLLLQHLPAIAPEKNDSLSELLASLGEVPTVESFLGENYSFASVTTGVHCEVSCPREKE